MWYRICDRIVLISSLEDNNDKYLSFGSVIPVVDKENDSWVHTLMPDGKKYKIEKKRILPYKKKINFEDLVRYAINNIGSPYVWGGKSGYGYDCSGLIQSLYRFVNIDLLRDCKDQIEDCHLMKIEDGYKIGDLIKANQEGVCLWVLVLI